MAGTAILVLVFLLALAITPAADAASTRSLLAPPLSHEGSFQKPCGVATDSLGNLYVAETAAASRKIYVYAPDGSLITEFTTGAVFPCNIAVDQAGVVFAAGGSLAKYTPSSFPPTPATTYTQSTFVATSAAKGIAVDPVSQNVLAAEQVNEVQKLTFTNATGGTFTLTFEGQTTAPITYSATAATLRTNIKNALLALPNVSGPTENVSVLGTPPSVTFQNELAGRNLALMTADAAGLTCTTCPATIAPSTTTDGSSRIASYSPAGALLSGVIGASVAGASWYGVGVNGATGNIYATDVANRKAVILDPTGATVLAETNGSESGAPFGAMPRPTLAVDQSSGNFAVSDVLADGSIKEFNAGAQLIDEIDHSPAFVEAEPAALAYDGSAVGEAGRLYVSSGVAAGSSVYAYGPLTPSFELTVTKAGSGGGTVNASLNGIEDGAIVCGSACAQDYPENAQVLLTADLDPGTAGVTWEGCDSEPGPTECLVAMSAAKEVTATLSLEQRQLTVTKSGSGTGTVTSSPAGIDCGSTCVAEFDLDSVVTLSASGGLEEWKGACTGSGPCEVTMDEAKAVEAVFVAQHQLSVSKSGSGTGTVTSSPPGINCGVTCSALFNQGQVVTLSTSAPSGNEFKEWTGACSGSTPVCEVTMSAAKSVGAKFDFVVATKSLTLNIGGTGSGTVTCNGLPCAEDYVEGTVLLLNAVSGQHSALAGWSVSGSGPVSLPCTGKNNPCEVRLSDDVTVGATFNLIMRKLDLTKTGGGDGSFACDTGSGPEACAPTYADGTTVEVTATPDSHSTFTGFSGACTGTGPCTIEEIEANTAVTADFAPIMRSLTLGKAGTGNGSFTCDTGSGPGPCQASYVDGTTITVAATPDVHSTFTGWSNGCTGTGTCVISGIAADTARTATFTVIPRTLTTTKTGTGDGTIACDTGSGPEPCASTYPDGTTITLTATPDSHSNFAGWLGAGCSGTGSCVIPDIAAGASVIASFPLAQRTFGIAKAGTGDGTITCSTGSGPEPCASSYPDGTIVTVVANPDSRSKFTGFAGLSSAVGCTISPCAVRLFSDSELEASFELLDRTLTVAVAGLGSGSVSCNGGPCAPSYPDGTTVNLVASPAAGSVFAGWAGACSGAGECRVTLGADSAVTAAFNAIPVVVIEPPVAEGPKGPRCRKGFKPRKVRGKVRCVKVKKKKGHKRSKSNQSRRTH